MNEYPLRSTITRFRGLFDRGNETDIPPDFFSDCLNIDSVGDGVIGRAGFLGIQSLAFTCVRAYVYKRLGEASRYLLLDTSGNLYDSLSPGSPILSIVGMTDFAFVNMYNKAYISPHNGTKGLAGQSVYVYDGTTCRVAAGSTPSGTLTAVQSGTVGNVDLGTHIFAIAYETSTGHITKPGPTLFATVLADGTKSIDLSGIPTGPSYVTKRHILATKAISSYDGNQTGYEFFFIPGATINNNVDTTKTVNFYDAQLVSSADYLFDQLETIPAGVFLLTYGNSLVVGGADTTESIFRVSVAGYPEAFDAVEGLRVVAPNEAGGLSNATVFRDSLYLTKSHRTYVTNNNGSSAAFWSVVDVDLGDGAECHSIAQVMDAKGTNVEAFVTASRAGAFLFNGAYTIPELSYNIKGIWDRINKLYFETVEVVQDPINKKIYFAVPLDAATTPSHILVLDYQKGLSYETARWYIWQPHIAPRTISVDVNLTTEQVTFRFCNNKIYELTSTEINDDSVNAINHFIETAPIRFEDTGLVYHFGGFRAAISGSGTLSVSVRGLNNSNSTSYNSFVLTASPGFEVLRRLNFENERMKLKLLSPNASSRFKLTKLAIFGTVSLFERPM